MPEKQAVCVAHSLDVEEEGLFSGRYQRHNPPLNNIRHLARLAPLLERGIKPTLFCAHCVLTDQASQKILSNLRDNHGTEIGAHLHHWNTPPLEDGVETYASNVAASKVDPALLRAKMACLFKAASDFQGQPVTSFRMGRWDLLAPHWDILRENGVLCDASVRPLHRAPYGPNHFDAPNDPYFASADGILEVPLTVVPLVTPLARPLPEFAAGITEKYQQNLKNWGALALLPVEHPLWLLKLTTNLHIKRGGRALSLTWHSSEMMPGGNPRLPDEFAVKKFLAKMEKYLDWLLDRYNITFTTMTELRHLFYPAPALDSRRGSGDWHAGNTGGAELK